MEPIAASSATYSVAGASTGTPTRSSQTSSKVSTETRIAVITREGQACWLCQGGSIAALVAAHQIPVSSELEEFPRYQEAGIIPEQLNSLVHQSNLISLCGGCHLAYDHDPPQWIMLPTMSVLDEYARHEHNDYRRRERAGQRGQVLLRTLPAVDPNNILYQPYIITRAFAERSYLRPSAWPRQWLGEPTAAIVKATGGISRHCSVARVVTMLGEEMEVGIPGAIRTKIVQLIIAWSRPAPPVRELAPARESNSKRAREANREDKDGDGGAAGAAESNIKGKGKELERGRGGNKRAKHSKVSGRQLRPRRQTEARKECIEKVEEWIRKSGSVTS